MAVTCHGTHRATRRRWGNPFGPCFELPRDAFVWGGRKPSKMKDLCLEYAYSLERHFSHYSMSSETEYTDAANSILQLWKGPCEERSDGSSQPCLLEWLDTKSQTSAHTYYTKKKWFPGVITGRAGATKPASIGADAPKLAVPYKYLLKVMGQFDLKLQDKTEDKCETCMQFVRKTKVGTLQQRATATAALLHHQQQAGDKYEILKFRWANFGWGKLPDGRIVHHPVEVWLYTCVGDDEDEWYKEEPTRVCFGRGHAIDGTPYKTSTFSYDLDFPLKSHGAERGYESYDGPLALALEKQHDLHSLRPMLDPTTKYPKEYLDAEWPAPSAPLPEESGEDDDEEE